STIRTLITIILTSFLIIVTTTSNSQTNGSRQNEELGKFEPLWWRTYGWASMEYGDDTEQTADGGFIIVGSTDYCGAGSSDVWLIKTNSTGFEEWNKTYGGQDIDFGLAAHQTQDGGYVIVGMTQSYGAGNQDIWLIKADSSGNEQWNRTYGGAGDETGFGLLETADEGYVIVGETSSYGYGGFDVWLLKTDGLGVELWNRTFGGSHTEIGSAIQHTNDGGYIIVGETESYGAGGRDFWLIKTNSSGAEQWNRTYGGGDYDNGKAVQQTSDGGYIIIGNTLSFGPQGDVVMGLPTENIWAIKTDKTGTMQWNKTYGNVYNDYGEAVLQTPDGGYIIAGSSGFFMAENFDIVLLKTDSQGVEEWVKSFGGVDYDFASSMLIMANGNYAIAGTIGSYGAGGTDAVLLEFDPKPPAGIQNDPPSCNITSPEPQSTISDIITVTGTASDPDEDPFIVQVKIGDGIWYEAIGTTEWSINLNTTKHEDGDHKLYARAFDGYQFSDYENNSIVVIVNNTAAEPGPDPERSEDEEFENIMPIIGIIIILIFITLFIALLATRKAPPPPEKPTRKKRRPPDNKLRRK
ncbi:MAG: hypothetical protein KAJ51_00675, partial [Thermoplasmata archaeon]|nr:hypothetical protein [Thermoplasmata archaeon]